MWPLQGSKLYTILEIIKDLSSQCVEGRVPVAEILLKTEEFDENWGSESVRMLLSHLKEKGVVEIPMRGMYVLTSSGKGVFNEEQ